VIKTNLYQKNVVITTEVSPGIEEAIASWFELIPKRAKRQCSGTLQILFINRCQKI
jgi:hypothetical protein